MESCAVSLNVNGSVIEVSTGPAGIVILVPNKLLDKVTLFFEDAGIPGVIGPNLEVSPLHVVRQIHKKALKDAEKF